jgi:pyruvate formate lyase activating enzyme
MIINATALFGRYSSDPEYDMMNEPVLESKADKAMYILMFKGDCNFKCQYCFFHAVFPHSPQTSIEKMVEDIQAINATAVGLFGMECTQIDYLPDVARAAKALGKEVHIHTNGSKPDMLEAMIDEGLVDFVALDIKGAPDKYELVTGVPVDLEDIKRSIALVKRLPDYKFRTAVCRELFSIEDIAKIAGFTGGGKRYELKGYWDAPKARNRENLSAYTHEEMLALKAEAEKYFDKVFILEGRRGLGNT